MCKEVFSFSFIIPFVSNEVYAHGSLICILKILEWCLLDTFLLLINGYICTYVKNEEFITYVFRFLRDTLCCYECIFVVR